MSKNWVFLVSIWVIHFVGIGDSLGVNWGTLASHKVPPKAAVQMLIDNGIQKVKLFDAERDIMTTLAGTGIEVMVAVPNHLLADMNDYNHAKQWVRRNIRHFYFKGGVNIKYVAVGNEPFLKSYNDTYVNVTYPALQNIQIALNEVGIGNTIKATVPLNADVYSSPSNNPVPSAGRFRSDVKRLMTQIVQFLDKNNAPFVVNIYPFLSLYENEGFPIDFAFFDGGSDPIVDKGTEYTNVFDANFDTLVSSLRAIGYGDMPIMIGEVGWPTDGDKNANMKNAFRFYNGLLPKLASNKGTPLYPKYIEVYLFGLLDENAKSTAPGNFERHWGLFRYDGQPKFPMDLSGQGRNVFLVGAKDVKYLPKRWCMLNPNVRDFSKLADSVEYACSSSDCTALGYGSSCNNLNASGNASYAFNTFYQVHHQDEGACDFDGLTMVTTQNISQGNCNFTIQLASSPSTMVASLALSFIVAFMALLVIV